MRKPNNKERRPRRASGDTATWVGSIVAALTLIVGAVGIYVEHGDSQPQRDETPSSPHAAQSPPPSSESPRDAMSPAPHVEPVRIIKPIQTPKPDALVASPYIDTQVRRQDGRVNVAVQIVTLPGSELAPIEGAAARALRERGYNVLPLFRERFAHDGLDQKLFNGDASLTRSLQLRRYCDRVVLGAVRFQGPAQHVGQGLFIREAVAVFRLIDPETGQVTGRELEIPVKGGGADAAASTADALRTLAEQIPMEVSAWSWT